MAFIELKKKDGSIFNCKIDSEDLQRVIDSGVWFAEWNKKFNSYLALRYVQGEKHREKQTLHSFILGADTKAPIRHINGDTLDNRKSNLEIYNRNVPNEYKELSNGTVELILRDKNGRESGRAIIDKEDLYRVINNGFAWTYYRSNEKPYAVANTPIGRVYLDRFIMNTPENTTVHHINLNTLDNRKANLENVEVSEETK